MMLWTRVWEVSTPFTGNSATHSHIFLTVIHLNPPAPIPTDLHVCSLYVMMSLQMKTFLNHLKSVRRQLFPPANLSVDFVEFCDQVSVAAAILESIWNKASQLLHTSNSIAVAPGLDPKSHTVISASGNRPHLVQAKKTGQYVCDKACGNWNSLSMCSHTVAVAEVNGELSKFVAWFVKAKKKASVSKLVLTGMPEGRGRKGGKRPQSKKKGLAMQTRTSIENIAGVSTSHTTGAMGASSTLRSSTSGVSNLREPSHPPPLVHCTPCSPSPTPEPFVLCFVTGNISVCYGCRQKYPKPCQPPDDLCVRHKEWREFFCSWVSYCSNSIW